jgi:hypothetical protein
MVSGLFEKKLDAIPPHLRHKVGIFNFEEEGEEV